MKLSSQTEHSTTPSSEVDYRLLSVNPEDLDAAWPEIGHLMQEVADNEYSGHTIESLINEVVTGNVNLWVISRDKVVAIMATMIKETGDGLLFMDIVMMHGTEMRRWFDKLLPAFETYAKSEGCNWVQCAGRKGWAKMMPDYKMTRVILRKVL